MLLLTLLLMLAVALGFLYHGRPYRAWVFPLALGFSVWGFRGGADSFWFWALLIPTALVATLFGVASIRRALISGFIMEKLGPILPTISDTEKAALEAGTVWWDGELF
ncbi:MAG: acyl-CoA dehydrogenase, partial [Candidatus Eisenbacteria bacterium]|nr:acyl-CoA dehydrogenase [Candidatus Eisenbacteria bacterium]